MPLAALKLSGTILVLYTPHRLQRTYAACGIETLKNQILKKLDLMLQRTYAACGIETKGRQSALSEIYELQRTYAACGIETP